MNLRLITRVPGPGESSYWKPFAQDSGFHFGRWSQEQTVSAGCTYLQAVYGDTEVVRIELDHGQLHARFRGLRRLPAPPLRIQMIETHVIHQRRHFAQQAVELLREEWPGRVLIAFSDADEFWDGIGWNRHINVDDDPDSPRMYPLYVDPSPILD